MITKLRLKLLEMGGPQYVIAVRAGMHPTRLSEYALGKPIPDRHVVPLCEVLQCDVEDILGWACEDEVV